MTARAAAENGNRLSEPSQDGLRLIYQALRNSRPSVPYPQKWPSFRNNTFTTSTELKSVCPHNQWKISSNHRLVFAPLIVLVDSKLMTVSPNSTGSQAIVSVGP